MPCKPATYVGAVADSVHETNLNGLVSYTAARRWQPAPDGSASASSGLAALVFAVAQTTADSRRLTPQGSRWSSMNLVQPDDGALSLKDLDRRLDYVIGPQGAALNDAWRARQFDPVGTQRLIHVESGMEVGALCEMLDANPSEPWALPTLGGANGQTLAGVISTSTHGGDWRQPPLPDLVRALHLVTDGGRELWIEPSRAPITDDVRLRSVLPCGDTEIIRSDEVFDAALVSFGRFGVIYSMILEVTRGFNVAEVITLMPSGPLLQAMSDGARAANPLAPLFAIAASMPLPATLKVRDEVLGAGDPMFFQLVYSSQDPTQAWVERRWPTANATPLHLPTGPDPGALFQAAIGIKLLNLAWSLGIDVAPAVNQQFADKFAPAMTDGVRGPHHLITSGTRLASHLPLAIGDSIEVVFDARNPNGVAFLRNALILARTYRQAGWISARPAQRSRATLSMHNLDTDLTWSFEITTVESAPDRAAWMNQLQDLALSYGGRPHWGQHNAIDATHVWHLYGKRMHDWHQALRRVSRDAATFSSDFTRRRGLDPTYVREVRAAFRTPSGALTYLVGPDGADWSPASVRDVMQGIRNGRAMYAIQGPGGRLVFLDVVNNPRVGGLYLRTVADGLPEDNLDRLPAAAGAPPPTVADAEFVAQDAPLSITAGTRALMHIAMYNAGTSVWERGRVVLASVPGAGLQVEPVALPQSTSPMQQVRFTVSILAGAANTHATLRCRLLENGRPFGSKSDPVTIVFTHPGEPAACEGIRQQIAALEGEIAMLEDQLDPDGDKGAQARLRRKIAKNRRAIADLRSEGSALGCALP